MVNNRDNRNQNQVGASANTFNGSNSIPNYNGGLSEDPASPYFLHHSDNPGAQIVTHQLIGRNHSLWSRSMIIALSAKNKLGFVTGAFTKPEDDDPRLAACMRNNHVVIAWIHNYVTQDISSSVLYSESAFEIWNELRECFQQSNGPRIFQLHKTLMNLRQEQDLIGIYFTKFMSLCEEMNNFRPHMQCSSSGLKQLQKFHQNKLVMLFFMGLNDCFAQPRSQVLLMDPIPSINKVFSLMVQEKRHRAIGHSAPAHIPIEAVAISSKLVKKFQRKERLVCTHCRGLGYTVDKCYKLHGFSPGYKAKSKK